MTLKPRLVSPVAVVVATPIVPEPLSTSSCTLDGLTVAAGVGLPLAAFAALRMWLSWATAEKRVSACGISHSTRFASSG